jgi:hypothetical protein
MPLYMDVHEMDAIDPDALAGAHERDLEVQGKYGVDYRAYWFSQDPARVFCLVEAPDADTATAVHRESHGLLADQIFEVREGA